MRVRTRALVPRDGACGVLNSVCGSIVLGLKLTHAQLAYGDGQIGFMDATKDYIAGLAAGVATVFIGHPFDTIKVKFKVGSLRNLIFSNQH